MNKETEEIVMFAGIAILVLIVLKGGLGNTSALAAQKLQDATDVSYANDATTVLSSIFD